MKPTVISTKKDKLVSIKTYEPDKGRPEHGKTYLLIGKKETPSIANGNTWAESEIKNGGA